MRQNVAKCEGGRGYSFPDRLAAGYAAQSVGEDDDDEPAQVLILRDVLSIFEQKNAVRPAPTDLIGELSLMEDRPWADWKNGRPITAHGLARLLKAFKVKTTVLKEVGCPVRLYLSKDIEAASLPCAAPSGGQHVTL